jgi:hypothetical protein
LISILTLRYKLSHVKQWLCENLKIIWSFFHRDSKVFAFQIQKLDLKLNPFICFANWLYENLYWSFWEYFFNVLIISFELFCMNKTLTLLGLIIKTYSKKYVDAPTWIFLRQWNALLKYLFPVIFYLIILRSYCFNFWLKLRFSWLRIF